jgi:hypothetical protein
MVKWTYDVTQWFMLLSNDDAVSDICVGVGLVPWWAVG